MKTRLMLCVSAVWLSLAPSRSLWSQSAQYYDFGSFYLASQGIPGHWQNISFQNLPSDIGPTLTISDVTFTGRYLVTRGLNTEPFLFNFDSDVPLGIHFANGARAFGAFFSSQLSPYFPSFSATLSLDNGESFTFTAPTDPNSTFFGFISPAPVMDLTLSDGGLFHPAPNISFHEELLGNVIVVTVPEPSTLILAPIGGLLLGWRSSRKRFSDGGPANL